MKAPVARSKTRLRFIFGIEGEVEVVERLVGVAEAGLLAAPFQQSVGATGEFVGDQHASRSMGAIGSACACRRRVSSTAAMPPSRSWRRARCSSMRFIRLVLLGFVGR